MKVGNIQDEESPPVPNKATEELTKGTTGKLSNGCARCTKIRWLLVLFLVLMAAILGILSGLESSGNISLYSDDGYQVETNWKITDNCVYSYCWSQKQYQTSAKLNVGEETSEMVVGGGRYVTVSTQLQTVDAVSKQATVKLTFLVPKSPKDCVRQLTAFAKVGGGYGDWGSQGSCGVGGGRVVTAQAQVKVT